jgi:hypothetical protein
MELVRTVNHCDNLLHSRARIRAQCVTCLIHSSYTSRVWEQGAGIMCSSNVFLQYLRPLRHVDRGFESHS